MIAQEGEKEIRRAFDSRPGKRRRLNGPAVDGELSSSDDEDVRMGGEGDAPMRAAKSRSTSPQPIIVEDQLFQPQRGAVKHEPVVAKSQTTTPMLYKIQRMRLVFSLEWCMTPMMKKRTGYTKRSTRRWTNDEKHDGTSLSPCYVSRAVLILY